MCLPFLYLTTRSYFLSWRSIRIPTVDCPPISPSHLVFLVCSTSNIIPSKLNKTATFRNEIQPRPENAGVHTACLGEASVVRPLQIVSWFLVHRPHPFQESAVLVISACCAVLLTRFDCLLTMNFCSRNYY